MIRKKIRMNIHHQKHLKTWLVSATVLVILAGGFVARTAFARITMNTIDPVGIVADKGQQVTVTGPIAVTAGERTELRVTVTQRFTGAVASGIAILRGTGELQQWEVKAKARGKASFEPGPATAVAIAVTSDRGQTTDAHQWLVNITLVDQ